MHFVLVSKTDPTRVMAGQQKNSPHGPQMHWPLQGVIPDEIFTFEMRPDLEPARPATITRIGTELTIAAGDHVVTDEFKEAVKTFATLVQDGETLTARQFSDKIGQHFDSPAAQATADMARHLPKLSDRSLYLFKAEHANMPQSVLNLPLFTQEQILALRETEEIKAYTAVPLENFLESAQSHLLRYAKGYATLGTALPPAVSIEIDTLRAEPHLEFRQKKNVIADIVKEQAGLTLNDNQMSRLIDKGASRYLHEAEDLNGRLSNKDIAAQSAIMARYAREQNTENTYNRIAQVIQRAVGRTTAPAHIALTLASGLKSHLKNEVPPGANAETYFEHIEHALLANTYSPAPEKLDLRASRTLEKEGYDTPDKLMALARGEAGLNADQIKALPNMGQWGYDALTEWAAQRDAVKRLNNAAAVIENGAPEQNVSLTELSELISSLATVSEHLGRTNEEQLGVAIKYAFAAIKDWGSAERAATLSTSLIKMSREERHAPTATPRMAHKR